MNGPTIIDHFRNQLADNIGTSALPRPRPLDTDPYLAMSLMQKAIRRGHEELALGSAATLLRSSPEGAALARLIEDTGLPFSEEGCVNLDDPIVAKMHEIVFSEEGRAAARQAADDGLPALAGVDPLIAKALSVDYGKHNMTTHTAGALVAELMRHMGYREAGHSAKTPPGCIARSGQMWTSKKN